MRYALIMAGGSGTRLWPASRRAHPKQFMRLLGRRSLLQATAARLRGLAPPERILIATHERWRAEVRRQLPSVPRKNIITEPATRNTAPCVALAILHLRRRDPDASLLVLPSDHLIGDAARFKAYARDGFRFVEEHPDFALTLGVRPTHPSTAYGYLQRGAPLAAMKTGTVERVRRFIEKPTAPRARRFLAAGTYLWNAGVFIWKTRTFEQLVARHMRGMARQLSRLEQAMWKRNGAAEAARIYSALPAQSIDYGIMEKAKQVAVLPCDVPWNDIGSWTALAEALPRDARRNVVLNPRRASLVDVRGSIIHNDSMRVAALGIRDLIVVQTGDTLLICPRERDQDIKALLEQLERDGKGSWL